VVGGDGQQGQQGREHQRGGDVRGQRQRVPVPPPGAVGAVRQGGDGFGVIAGVDGQGEAQRPDAVSRGGGRDAPHGERVDGLAGLGALVGGLDQEQHIGQAALDAFVPLRCAGPGRAAWAAGGQAMASAQAVDVTASGHGSRYNSTRPRGTSIRR